MPSRFSGTCSRSTYLFSFPNHAKAPMRPRHRGLTAVRVARLLAVCVMDTVLEAPPHRAALRGEAAEHRENDGEGIGARERAVGGPAVQD